MTSHLPLQFLFLTFLTGLFSVSPAPAAQPEVDQEAQRPVAWVFDHADRWTGRQGAADLLETAGFEVRPLPLNQSPWELEGLIFIASFASEDPRYAPYMAEYADDLYNFVDKGNLLVQMTQADQTEAQPPFLPTTHTAGRIDSDFKEAFVITDNPLLEDVPLDGKRLDVTGDRTVWETFNDQSGFEVILAGDAFGQFPALMEGAYGQGRIVLSALAFDKVGEVEEEGQFNVAPERWVDFNKEFFRNLRDHTLAVRARGTEALSVTPSPTKGGFVEGSWTLAVLPDTQVYSLRVPGLFDLQTDWVLRNAGRLDVKYVLHLGDIVNNNTAMEWERARAAMSRLDGKVPYAMVPGNHDYGPSGDASTRHTLMNDYFPFDKLSSFEGFGGAMEEGKLDNTWHLFEAGGREWIILALEWGPRDETIEWANQVMADHPDRVGILVTHAYMNNNDRRYDHTDTEHPQHYNPHDYRTPGGVNDGQELWDKLVSKHDFAFTLNGHVLGDGTGYLASKNDTGTTTHQMLSNYQMRQLGGEGYLRIFEFFPDGQTVRIHSYSPLYDRYLLDPDQQMTLKLDQPRTK